MIRTLLFHILFLVFLNAWSQESYLIAKNEFKKENWGEAQLIFESLRNDAKVGKYATFYWGLSLYHNLQHQEALKAFNSINTRYPKWVWSDLIKQWLGKLYLELHQYEDVVHIAKQLKGEKQNQLINTLVATITAEDFLILKQEFPAENLLMNLPFEHLKNITDIPFIRKDTFSVALLMPFLFESLDDPTNILKNRVVLDFYQGVKFAQQQLKSDGVHIQIAPYDTKKDSFEVKHLIDSGVINNVDVIIGPLYSEQIKMINAFSELLNIPVINPISSNDEIIGHNSLFFLFNPSIKTQGRKAGEFAAKNLSHNKNVLVFYETVKDQKMALEYMKTVGKMGFNIKSFESIDRESAFEVQRRFTKKYEEVLNEICTQEEIEEMMLLPERTIKSRVVRDKETGRINVDEKGDPILEYYEEKLSIPTDSIGHIFLASSSNLIANSFINILEVRRDLKLIGSEKWLEFKLMSYEQMMRLGIYFVGSTNFMSSMKLSQLQLKMKEAFGENPRKNHLMGYELMMKLGILFVREGKNFFRAFKKSLYLSGVIAGGSRYGIEHQDNQIVPILQLIDYELQNMNIDY